MENNTDYLLKLAGITRSFPGVKALDDVTFDIKRGSIHALVGENGAGKSTLIKILAGIYKVESGSISFDGKDVAFNTPSESQASGISVVHQELKLSETLTVAENIFLGKLPYLPSGMVDWAKMRRRASEMLEDLGIEIDVNMVVSDLSVAKKQMVEICKAVSRDAKLLIMDEPSAVLTEKEQKLMFSVINRLHETGMTFIYISHRLDEIFSLADMVTVLRDGKMIQTLPVADVDKTKLISLMVGRELANEYPKEDIPIGEVVLDVKNVVRKGVLHDISFHLRKGEILGFAGLVGSGRTELMRAFLGIDKTESAEITLDGKKLRNKSFRNAIQHGFGLIPEDRKQQGLIQIFSVKINTSMVSLKKFLRFGLINTHAEAKSVDEYVDKVNVITPSIETEVQYLSGGNQQKVVIAKWLMEQSRIYILDEPTRGIDVGAKTEIYKLITELIKQGNSVIMVSSEMPELIGMCDRIYVMHEGHLAGELSRKEATQEKIMAFCI